MSENERRIPGERTLNRVLRRGTVRPSVGTPAAFYERFGLADPLLDAGFVPGAQLSSDDGLFSFLSAEPYYRALRAQASWRSGRARRRLLGRLVAQSDAFAGNTQHANIGRVRSGARRASFFASAVSSESALTMVERAETREEILESLEAEGWTPGGRSERPAPTRRLRERSRQVSGRVATLLDTVEAAAPVTERRRITRIRRQVAQLSETEQVIVVEQLARQVRGPIRRALVVQAEAAGGDVSQRPVAVAQSRAATNTGRSKGLRPVLGSSPSLQTLASPVPEAQQAEPVSRLRRVDAPRSETRRGDAAQRASTPARDIRAKRNAGRAGPSAVEADTAVPVSAPLRRAEAPTVRVARRVAAVESATFATPLRGTDVVEIVERPAAEQQARIVRRATRRRDASPLSTSPVVRVDEPSERARLFAPSPLVARSAPRASERFASERVPVAQSKANEPAAVGRLDAGGPARPSRARATRQVTHDFRLAEPQVPLTAEVAAPSSERARPSSSPRASAQRRSVSRSLPTVRAARRLAAVSDAPTVRPGPVVADALRRSAPAQRVASPAVPSEPNSRRTPVAAARRVPAPSVQTVASFAPERRIAEAATAPVRRSRVHVAQAPTHYLQPVSEASVDVAAVPSRAPRPTERIAARADTTPQVDSRDVATSLHAPTRYVDGEDHRTAQSISRSPVVRRSRAVAHEGTPIQHAEPETIVPATEAASRRLARSEEIAVGRTPRVRAPVDRRSATPRATEPTSSRPLRAQEPVASRISRRVAAVEPTVVRSSEAPPPSEPVRVRDVRGQVVRKSRIGTGSVVYASARVEEALAAAPTASQSFKEPVSERRERTPLAARRRRAQRPVGYARASKDYRMLVPVERSLAEAVRTSSAGSSARRAAAAVKRLRVEAPSTMRAATLGTVLREISGVVRAMERAEAPPTATRVAARASRPVASVPTPASAYAPRLSRSPVARFTPRVARSGEGRRLRVGEPGQVALHARPSGVDHADQPASVRHTAPGRPASLAGSPSAAGSASFTRSASPTRSAAGARPRGAGVAPVSGDASLRSPTRRSRGVRAFDSVAYAEHRADSLVEPTAQFTSPATRSAAAVARPRLVETLGQMTKPPAAGRSTRRRDAAPSVGRNWARRATLGTAAEPTPLQHAAPADQQTAADGSPLKPNRPGTILHALARASSAEDVVRVILERADGLRGVAKELPQPAVELVERIVRVQDEANAPKANVVHDDDLAPLSAPRSAPVSETSTASSRRNAWSGTRSRPTRRSDGVGAGQTMKLANKLMRLVHLAENERRLAEAQRHVRMSQEGSEVDSGGEQASGEAVGVPNIKALQRDVFEAVLREIALSKQRRQEDFDVSIWW